MSLGATGGMMVLAGAFHPPTGETTRIIALGLITRVADLGIVELAVTVLAAEAFVMNRLAGINDPRWSPAPASD